MPQTKKQSKTPFHFFNRTDFLVNILKGNIMIYLQCTKDTNNNLKEKP